MSANLLCPVLRRPRRDEVPLASIDERLSGPVSHKPLKFRWKTGLLCESAWQSGPRDWPILPETRSHKNKSSANSCSLERAFSNTKSRSSVDGASRSLSAPLLLFPAALSSGRVRASGRFSTERPWIAGGILILLGLWSIWFGLFVDRADWQ